MSKDEIFLTIFLYCLVVLISSSKPFWDQIGSLGWVQSLAVQLQKPVFPEGAPGRVAPIVVMKTVSQAEISKKRIHKPRKKPGLILNGMTTVKRISTKEENTKG